MKKLGIIGAMAVEVENLKQQMRDVKFSNRAGMEFCEGTLAGLPVVVVQCGVGKVNAALCVQILCDCFGVTHLINTGVAGSLCAELDIGDFVISRDAMYHDFTCQVLNPAYCVGQVPGLNTREFPADEAMVDLAFAAAEGVHTGHCRIGRIASGDQFIADKARKAQIVADTGAICTEMEGSAIAHAAWRNGIPFVIIRAISDKADDSAEMDYPIFEAIAARRCADVIVAFAQSLI
jgi:adenosylhomocysteine nucleosidase